MGFFNSDVLLPKTPGKFFGKSGDVFGEVAYNFVVGVLENRCFRILVDRDDDSGRFHAGQMLDGTGDTAGNVQIRLNGLSGLTNLVSIRYPTCVYCCATGSHCPSKSVCKGLYGGSVLDFLSGKDKSPYAGADQVGYELFGMKAYFDGDWKILWMPPPFGPGDWQLYKLSEDPGELIDLSDQQPERLVKMIAQWEQYKQENRVLDISLNFSNDE